MAGQIWSSPAEGGYLYSDELSDILRNAVQPRTRFRQLADARDGTQKGLNKGDTFHWNVISDVGRQGRELAEDEEMPETGFQIRQEEMTITEYGQSIPFTQKLTNLAKQDLIQIIDQALKNDCAKGFDIAAWAEFNQTLLRYAPTGGTSTIAVTLTTNGATATTNNVALATGHIKAMVDDFRERNVPAFLDEDYIFLSHPSTLRPIRNELEDVHQYTPNGLQLIFNGEIGRYESTRFIEQNNIPKGGADDSTVFDPYTRTPDPWNNAKSGWGFLLGADTITEAVAMAEEIRAKLPGDYGRSKGIAWYALEGFKRVHTDATQTRIAKWDSAA